MSKIIDRIGKGAALTAAEYDSNISTAVGKNQPITATTHTITVNDQSEVIEYSNAAPIAVTLPDIVDVSGSNIHTDDFSIRLKNIGVGLVTITTSGTDTFDDGSTSIQLTQSEFVEIQTDNSLTKWNVFENNIQVLTVGGTQSVFNKTMESPVVNTPIINSPALNGDLSAGDAFLDEDDMASDSAIKLASQQSIKAYTDAKTVLQPAIQVSGNQAEFLSIPAGINKVTLSLVNVEVSLSLEIVVRLGDSTSYPTNIYDVNAVEFSGTSLTTGGISSGSYFGMTLGLSSGTPVNGVITLVHQGGNRWACESSCAESGGGGSSNYIMSGRVVLSGELTRILVNNSNGDNLTGTNAYVGAIFES